MSKDGAAALGLDMGSIMAEKPALLESRR